MSELKFLSTKGKLSLSILKSKVFLSIEGRNTLLLFKGDSIAEAVENAVKVFS